MGWKASSGEGGWAEEEKSGKGEGDDDVRRYRPPPSPARLRLRWRAGRRTIDLTSPPPLAPQGEGV